MILQLDTMVSFHLQLNKLVLILPCCHENCSCSYRPGVVMAFWVCFVSIKVLTDATCKDETYGTQHSPCIKPLVRDHLHAVNPANTTSFIEANIFWCAFTVSYPGPSTTYLLGKVWELCNVGVLFRNLFVWLSLRLAH